MNYYLSLTGKTSIPSLPDKDKDISAAFECLRLKKIIEDPSNDEITYQYESVSTATLLDGKTAIKGKSTGKQSVLLRMVLRDLAMSLGEEPDGYYQTEMSRIIDHYKAKIL
jgi:hypothetical protein